MEINRNRFWKNESNLFFLSFDNIRTVKTCYFEEKENVNFFFTEKNKKKTGWNPGETVLYTGIVRELLIQLSTDDEVKSTEALTLGGQSLPVMISSWAVWETKIWDDIFWKFNRGKFFNRYDLNVYWCHITFWERQKKTCYFLECRWEETWTEGGGSRINKYNPGLSVAVRGNRILKARQVERAKSKLGENWYHQKLCQPPRL